MEIARYCIAPGDMNIKPIYRVIAPIVLSIFLLTACGSPSSTPSDSSSTPPPPTNVSEPTPSQENLAAQTPQKGGAFNKFFPDVQGSDYERTFTQEKEGFAEIKLTLDGKEMAKISISDTVTNLSAQSKFADSTETISGYPAVAQGSKANAVLVGDRYQVKAMSRDDAFTEGDRKEWLAKVDLKGLAALQ